jgi:hypothetical protein
MYNESGKYAEELEIGVKICYALQKEPTNQRYV